MGRGDGRSRKGKIFKGSYGNTRTHKVKKAVPSAAKTGAGKAVAGKAVAPKKSPATKKSK
jgi:30S ribosomal protein S31